MGCISCLTKYWSRLGSQQATEDLESSEHLWLLPMNQSARCPTFSMRVLSPVAYLRPVRLTCWALVLLTAASVVIWATPKNGSNNSIRLWECKTRKPLWNLRID